MTKLCTNRLCMAYKVWSCIFKKFEQTLYGIHTMKYTTRLCIDKLCMAYKCGRVSNVYEEILDEQTLYGIQSLAN